ncbi:M48 family metallopeptidase [Desulfosediminicola sp.]|uniref:M48 family metallopeptidase n=1 Tax=Desulfosediminicola sp. TaxID=2886825 RepID=UPI003AF2BD1B
MNSWLIFLLVVIIGSYLLELTISYLNLKALDPQLPKEFDDVFDAQEYAKSQEYTRARTSLSLISGSIGTCATLTFLLLGGFNLVDSLVRSLELNSILTGLCFAGFLALLGFLLNLPFSLYSTFVIEERFGFNNTTATTYVLDILKSALLMVVLGGPLLALILWFFEAAGSLAWIYCWIGVVLFSILIQFLAPVIIMPLFNKFSPLEDGELKETINGYTEREKFRIQGIFTMDGSKRSSKVNAFFTGFGRFRKIVFYDTLMEKLTTGEIVAVLAHEMGHFKKKHIIKMLVISVVQTGIMFYLLSLIMHNQGLFEAFKMDHISTYASLIFFGYLFSPVNMLVSIAFNFISRKHEYEADAYAIDSTSTVDDLISGLKKLSQANLVNLTPHPVAVFVEYTHPPVLERIEAIRKLS